MSGEGDKGKGKRGTVGSHNQPKEAVNIDAAVVSSCAVMQTGQSVPPPTTVPADLDAGAVQASITLASLKDNTIGLDIVDHDSQYVV